MNKEKAEKISPTYGKLLAENYRLRHNEKVLSNRIDKAIELIEKDRNKNYGSLEKKSFYCSKTNKLLEILRGSDK